MTDDVSAASAAALSGLLDLDAQGWALARSVREGGEIVDFELVYLNDAGARILGRPRAELVGRRYRQLWPHTVHDGTLPLYRQVVQTRVPVVRTVYYDTPTVRGHFEVHIGPYEDGFAARFVDLTQVKMAPHSDGGTRLYQMLDAAFDGFTLLHAVRDADGVVVDFVCEYVNDLGAKITGRAVQDLIGRPLSEISPSSRASGLFDRYRDAVDSGTPWRQQLPYPELGQVWEIKLARAEEDFVAVSFRDVTEQVSQEQALADSAAQARQAAERVGTLQAATEALVAASTSAEVYAAMGQVVRPSAGGHGLVVLLADGDDLTLAYHAGYETDVVAQLRRLPLSHQYPAAAVAATGQPRYLTSPAEFTAAQPDPATAISGGGRQAWAFLPLATAGRVLGTLVIGYAERRDFDADERAYLVALSRLCAQALQRSLLFEAQQSIAAALQRALLPAALPQVPGVRHAVRYLPWTHGADVGGDWYDLIALGPDVIAVVIGDVVGHSASAAATMGQVRNAIRAFASDGHTPTGIMQRVNRLLAEVASEAVATCCYLELHLAEGTATAVLAGHPPPVLRTGDQVTTLDLRVSPPLGAAATTDYADTSFLVPTASNLVLYTDGLVEDRRFHITRGIAELSEAIRNAPSLDPMVVVDHILAAGIGPRPRTDDVAMLALTVDAGPPPGVHKAERAFRSDALSAAAARRFAADILTAWGQPKLVDDATLLLDEIITNAVQHTLGDVRVRMTLCERLRVEVHDHSQHLPTKRPTSTDSETGRGLHIVDSLAHTWGSHPHPDGGKTVWFELQRSPA